jgi:hypothetical protein
MKKTIVCIKDNKAIGYWIDEEHRIATKTISVYSDQEELEKAYTRCSTYIPYHYGEDIIPIIMLLSFETPAESIAERCKKHLENAKLNWPHMPERLDNIEKSINKIAGNKQLTP